MDLAVIGVDLIIDRGFGNYQSGSDMTSSSIVRLTVIGLAFVVFVKHERRTIKRIVKKIRGLCVVHGLY